MTATASNLDMRRPARLFDRELDTYPKNSTRFLCLGIVVLATVVLYYQLYMSGALAVQIMQHYGMSFTYFVNFAVVGYVLGAVASFTTGFADRYGRANIVVFGLLIVALLCLIGFPNAHSGLAFASIYCAIGVVEGVILVATPALIRDFSPQLGRAAAMGFWTLGPVVGSLAVSIQTSSLSSTTSITKQYVIAGIIGLVIFVFAAFFLRELSPQLRDQLMVTDRDRALVEARAKGIDVEASLRNPFGQMLKPDIMISAFAISVFLLIYYCAVGFFPVYFETIFGFSESKANAIGNWTWAANAVAVVLVGLLSDRLRVRKPLMIVGAVVAIVMTIIFLMRATHPTTSTGELEVIVTFLSLGLGIAYCPWMASFTETVEKRNPALMATGLSVWGLIIRLVIAVATFIVPHIVTSATTLVEQGPVAQQYAAQYSSQIATAQKLAPATSAALAKNPSDPTAVATAISQLTGIKATDVGTVLQASASGTPVSKLPAATQQLLATDGAKIQAAGGQLQALGKVPANVFPTLENVTAAAAKSPHQWQHYFWITVGGEIFFIPCIFLMAGYWSPRRAKQAEQEHEAWLDQELMKLNA